MNRKRALSLFQNLFGLAVIVGIGVYFRNILANPALEGRFDRIDIPLLIAGGLLYPICHTLWGTFWWQLLRRQQQPVPWGRGVSTYFVSQFGKYVPGKVWVILLRMMMLKKYGISQPVVFVTGIAESLVTVASGALLGVAALIAAGIELPYVGAPSWVFALLGMVPVASILLFNFIQGIVRKRRPNRVMRFTMPPIPLILRGMVQNSAGWALLGVSTGLVIAAVRPGEPAFSIDTYLPNLAATCLGYVAGFVILVAPGGIGIREFVMAKILMLRWVAAEGADVAEATAIVAALFLRLVWTVGELMLAGTLWVLSKRRDAHG